MVRRVVRGTGKTLIASGVLILLFVVYQLWGTGLAHQRAQKSLRSDFASRLAAAPPATLPGEATSPVPSRAVPPVAEGAVALMKIPKIGLDQVVREGVGVEDLKSGPGHYPGTRMPGELGNAAIAGHRTTYGAPFNRLDELAAGDPIEVTTLGGVFRYEVVEQKIVHPDEVSVLDETEDGRLTLTTCHPKYSAAERLIVVARLTTPVEPPDAALVGADAPLLPFREQTSLAAEEERAGLSGKGAARGPTLAWGIVAAAVWLATWGLSRMWARRWPAYLLGAPVFLAVLFMFFENVARLLPANV
jgi:sortase A